MPQLLKKEEGDLLEFNLKRCLRLLDFKKLATDNMIDIVSFVFFLKKKRGTLHVHIVCLHMWT